MDNISYITPSYTGVRDPDNPGYTGYTSPSILDKSISSEQGSSVEAPTDTVDLSPGARSQLK